MYACGNNRQGQLGLDTLIDSPRPVEVPGLGSGAETIGGGPYSVFAVVNGVMWSIGDNSKGQLGVGDTTVHKTPQQVTFFDDKQVQSVSYCSGVSEHTLVVTHTAWGTELYAFGLNSKGQLGLQETVATPPNQLSPQLVTFFAGKAVQLTAVGNLHSLVLAGE